MPWRSCGRPLLTGTLVFLMACARPPTSPDPARAAGSNIVPGLKLVGPDSLWPGEAAQFSMVEVLPDGTSTDVTSQATWTATPQAVLSTSPTGLVSGRIAGIGTLSVEYRGLVRARTIAVNKDPGTFLLSGIVTSSGLPVPGVRVEVLSRPLTGKVVTTNWNGAYSFFGVAGDVDLRWSKEGYLERTQRVSMDDYKGPTVDTYKTVSLTLDPVRALMEVAGSYTITIRADACDAKFPDALKTRVYSGTVSQTGARTYLILSGADFDAPDYFNPPSATDRAGGIAGPATITFVVLGIAERVGQNLALSFGGESLTLSATPDGLFGKAVGGIHTWYLIPLVQDGRSIYRGGSCQSADVSFVRR